MTRSPPSSSPPTLSLLRAQHLKATSLLPFLFSFPQSILSFFSEHHLKAIGFPPTVCPSSVLFRVYPRRARPNKPRLYASYSHVSRNVLIVSGIEVVWLMDVWLWNKSLFFTTLQLHDEVNRYSQWRASSRSIVGVGNHLNAAHDITESDGFAKAIHDLRQRHNNRKLSNVRRGC